MKLDESSGDWLDILPKHFQRSPPGPPLPPTPGSYDQPIMLIGIVSALQLRRDLLRCTWLRELSSIGGTRTLFVVGANAGDSGSADVLPTHIEEQQLMRRAGRHSKQVKIHGVTSYSTYSLYAKTMHFLKYAAEQPEPIVSLVDDDVFLQPRALMSYAWTLLRASRLDSTPRGELGGGDWYAGRFDWYSWRTETLQPTAYWRGLRGALYGGSLPFRNCSPTGAGWIYGGKDGKQPLREAERPNAGAERCVGPFAFAKGPFAMLSTSAIRWLVASAAFERDVSLAAAIANGTRPRGLAVERVPQDVQMGYWLSSHPTLRYISIPRKTTWADAFVEVTDLQRLLIAHRVPWDQIGWLTSRTQRLWAVSPARLQFRCGGPPCPKRQCSHARGQVACAIDIVLGSAPPSLPSIGCNNCNCWEEFASGRVGAGGQCNFTRYYKPSLPTHCLAAT